MTRIVTIAAVILLLTLFVGCQSDTGTSQRLPKRSNPIVSEPNKPLAAPGSSNEIDLVEKMSSNRQAYQRSLQALIQYYDACGNHQKLTWAKQELTALDRIPQWRYNIEAEVMPANLKATERIPAADQLFEDAEKIRRQAGPAPMPTLLKDEEVLRAALAKYDDLIRRYPTSDKIDDAAYRMAEIHEGFRDFTIALSFYQRAYQWDPATPYPARFKAADILDKKLHRRDEALQLYQEAVVKEAQFTDWKLMAERRIQELNTSKDSPK
jgi:tetratricopeptide (TPR) repeat protein